ncbi:MULTISPECIES: DUF1887 family CARF protein [unclassified Clostridium]|uniref:Card1-like endonuclease domain-containing protein n=1 Tax=unclassified Clostridium TaxID=2614128 RepID=UPI00189B2A63|nr:MULTISPECIES: DUF1887 family CARF protein [unclassified Clostridium]MBP3915025.1 DUF1887 family protein [Clostridium sp.]
MIDILINQVDEHNESNILATQEFKPNLVYFIKDKDSEEKMKTLRLYYEKNFKKIKIEELLVEEGDKERLEKIISRLKEKNRNILINLTGGKRINSLILLDLCIKEKLIALYINIKKKIIYEFKDNIKIYEKTFEDLEIDDIVKASGGKIIEDSSELCNKKDLIYFAEKISSNLELWHKYKQQLYESSIFEHDSNETQRIYIHTQTLEDEEINLLDKILSKFKEMNEISYKKEKNRVVVNFNNEYLKAFIFKSGTWLEIETNKLINSIEEIDESKNGVMFLWNDENQSVRNELDVVAVKDSVPIFISCKDSDKYNEMALNELNVYATKFGGENSYKILVATKEPIKSPVRTRAKEMGIYLIIFDGNEEKFIKEIKNIINN